MPVGSFSEWCPCALKDLCSRLSDETLRRGVIAFRPDRGGGAPAQEQHDDGSGEPDVHRTPFACRGGALGYAKWMSDTNGKVSGQGEGIDVGGWMVDTLLQRPFILHQTFTKGFLSR